MAANYAKINKVGRSDADFQQAPLVQNFWNLHDIVMEHQWYKSSDEKQKNNF